MTPINNTTIPTTNFFNDSYIPNPKLCTLFPTCTSLNTLLERSVMELPTLLDRTGSAILKIFKASNFTHITQSIEMLVKNFNNIELEQWELIEKRTFKIFDWDSLSNIEKIRYINLDSFARTKISNPKCTDKDVFESKILRRKTIINYLVNSSLDFNTVAKKRLRSLLNSIKPESDVQAKEYCLISIYNSIKTEMELIVNLKKYSPFLDDLLKFEIGERSIDVHQVINNSYIGYKVPSKRINDIQAAIKEHPYIGLDRQLIFVHPNIQPKHFNKCVKTLQALSSRFTDLKQIFSCMGGSLGRKILMQNPAMSPFKFIDGDRLSYFNPLKFKSQSISMLEIIPFFSTLTYEIEEYRSCVRFKDKVNFVTFLNKQVSFWEKNIKLHQEQLLEVVIAEAISMMENDPTSNLRHTFIIPQDNFQISRPAPNSNKNTASKKVTREQTPKSSEDQNENIFSDWNTQPAVKKLGKSVEAKTKFVEKKSDYKFQNGNQTLSLYTPAPPDGAAANETEPCPGKDPTFETLLHPNVARWSNVKAPLSVDLFANYQGSKAVSAEKIMKLQTQEIEWHRISSLSLRFIEDLGIRYDSADKSGNKKINYLATANFINSQGVTPGYFKVSINQFKICIESRFNPRLPKNAPLIQQKQNNLIPEYTHFYQEPQRIIVKQYNQEIGSVELKDEKAKNILEIFKSEHVS